MYKYSIRLIAFVCVFLCSKVLSAGNESLSVTAKPHKSVLLIGEPLYISSSIKNNGKSAIELHYAGGPRYSVYEDGWASVLISEDGETYRGWGSGTQRAIYKTAPIKFEAGQEYPNKFTVLYGHYQGNNNELVFREEKPYFICVEYSVRSEGGDWLGIQSTPFRIDVTKPKGEDLSLWEKLQTDTKYAEIVQGPEEITLQQDELDRLSDLCKKYSKTTYAPYIALSLGRYYAKKDYVRGVPVYDKEKEEKALVYLDMVHRITEDTTLREKAYIILKRLRPTEEIVREKGTEIVIKEEGCLEEMISFIKEETGIEISIEEVWLPAIEKGGYEDIVKIEEMMLNKKSKYSFEAKVKKGDKEEMLEIAKSFLKKALTILKLTKKISIEEKEGKIYLVPR